MKKPDFTFECRLWGQGIEAVIGVDEVGRGSLAGPVVAAAAAIRIMNYESRIKKKNILDKITSYRIDDSKRLTASKRAFLVPLIKKHFHTATGQASVEEINRLGIVRATALAMRRALRKIQNSFRLRSGQVNEKSNSKFKFQNSYILVDGRPVKYLPGGKKRQTAITGGDRKSVSIAAASVVAKVYRDRLMAELEEENPLYGWSRNKGYGTLFHRMQIKKYGVCRHHRELFVDSLISFQ